VLNQVVHNADEEKDRSVQKNCVHKEESTLFDKDHLYAKETVPSQICLRLDKVCRAHFHWRYTSKVTLRVYQSQLGNSEHNYCNHNDVKQVLEHSVS